MNPRYLTSSILAAAFLFSANPQTFAAGQTTHQAAQSSFQAKRQDTGRIIVRSPAAAQRAFQFAAGQQSTAIEITCHPPTHDWCANDFQAACDKNDGGLSTEPDGGITCSMPD